ncbi:hypothetical protein Ccel01_18340 [Cellulosimicrobium cellulans]|uniref:Uncharacterized protein n=1 Tax=Cellulosimicrobium cellulans TaxID=1710 RepID=A0AAV5P7F1_CELCE|nr:hypothetical protein Ccel01_18340 [Cellulosimicrobium cellulans]
MPARAFRRLERLAQGTERLDGRVAHAVGHGTAGQVRRIPGGLVAHAATLGTARRARTRSSATAAVPSDDRRPERHPARVGRL